MIGARALAFFAIQIRIYIRTKTPLFVSLVFPIMMIFVFGSIQPRDYLETIIPGLIGFSILTDSLFTITGMAAKYRLMNIFSQLSLTPLKKSEWLISVFAWHLIISVISFSIIVGIGHFVYSANITLSTWIAAYLFFGTLLFVSLGLLIGTVAKSVEGSGLISNAIGFPMMVLTGTFFPVSLLPWYLQDFVKVLPLYYFVQGLGDITVAGNASNGLLFLGVVIAMSVAVFLMAVRLFKWRET